MPSSERIRLQCTACGARLKGKPSLLGRTTTCPRCKQPAQFQAAPDTRSAPAAPAAQSMLLPYLALGAAAGLVVVVALFRFVIQPGRQQEGQSEGGAAQQPAASSERARDLEIAQQREERARREAARLRRQLARERLEAPSKPPEPAPTPATPKPVTQPEPATPVVTTADKPKSASEIYELAKPSVVVLVAKRRDSNAQALGSGFIVEPGNRLVTNYHVIAGATDVEIYFADKTKSTVEACQLADKDRDLAVLPLPNTEKRPCLALAKTLPKVGENVYSLGAPAGLSFTLAPGIVSAIRGDGTRDWLIQTNAPISPGSSGGPLLNTRGEVVGVNTMTLVSPDHVTQNLNFAVASSEVNALLVHSAKTQLLEHLPEAQLIAALQKRVRDGHDASGSKAPPDAATRKEADERYKADLKQRQVESYCRMLKKQKYAIQANGLALSPIRITIAPPPADDDPTRRPAKQPKVQKVTFTFHVINITPEAIALKPGEWALVFCAATGEEVPILAPLRQYTLPFKRKYSFSFSQDLQEEVVQRLKQGTWEFRKIR